MDKTLLVMLLLSGIYVHSTSFPNVYYFIKKNLTWDEADKYCIKEHTALAQIQNMENATAMMNIQTAGFTDKAWIGLSNTPVWTWVDGEPATYLKWEIDQPDNIDTDEYCVKINGAGRWGLANCSLKKPFVCQDEVDLDKLYESTRDMTWNDAKTSCKESGRFLVTIPDPQVNSKVKLNAQKTEIWIGLSKPKLWYWSEPGENHFTNWKEGQPDNSNGEESCAAVALKDGTWTDEPCNAIYPFFCYGDVTWCKEPCVKWNKSGNRVLKARKTVVRVRITSSANMKYPTCSADLQRQLEAALATKGVTDFQLTWKKRPVKRT
ncbi:C-type mannose receptor 2-like isoform X1 [Eleginops maclovinus]|uniref:C-type mannose receptor 2-like isoform X1 n=1 Tax=Eleginops maclovinus TaxID=56733 RepID=UPI0030803F4C